jgi:hypothetical protein
MQEELKNNLIYAVYLVGIIAAFILLTIHFSGS